MSSRFIHKRDTSIQLILTVGLKLFAQHGFHSTTIRMIAEKAGISLGLLYNYFKSKEEVLLAIFRNTTPEIQASFIASIQAEQKVTLIIFMRQYFRIVKNNKDYWQLYQSLRLSSNTALLIREEVKAFNVTVQSLLESCLTEAAISFPGLEAKLILAAMDGMTNHFLLQENFPVDDLVNLLWMKYQP